MQVRILSGVRYNRINGLRGLTLVGGLGLNEMLLRFARLRLPAWPNLAEALHLGCKGSGFESLGGHAPDKIEYASLAQFGRGASLRD